MIFYPSATQPKDIYKLMIGSITPRPIALVSSTSKDGTNNLAPFSFFTGVSANPPVIGFSPLITGKDRLRDSRKNIEDTKEFVVNIVSESFAEKMVVCSTDYESDVDEFIVSGLNHIPSEKIISPRLSEAKISFECKLNQIVEVGDGKAGSGFIVIGNVILFHIDDSVMIDGRIDIEKLNPIGRLAGNWYTRPTDNFRIQRKIKPDK